MIRVCLVDDQTLVRQGIRSLLALDGGIEVIAEASDGKQAIEVVPACAPDVVLMDMRMPVMSGLEALQALSRTGQLPPTIILTTFDDDQLVLAGLKAGARGYLLKDVSLDQLVGAIQLTEKHEILLISDQGTLVRTRVDEVRGAGRNTQGVILIKLAEDEILVGLERVQEPSGGDEDELEVLEGEVVEQNEEAVTEAEDGAETGNSEE